MGDPVRRETATTTVAAEAIEIKRKEFLELARREDARLDPLQKDVSRRVIDNARMQVRPEAGSLMNFLMREGLGEATNVLVIDESLCVGCDNCEKACAETHGGVSRLDREAGATYANVHIPTACRHCEQPHCMKDCPPNAIRRSESGEVYINDSCIGCGNCQANCPYGVIRMVYDAPKKPRLVVVAAVRRQTARAKQPGYEPSAAAKEKGKKAVKCDACVGIDGGPACVRACPTGAAIRIGPEQFVDLRRGAQAVIHRNLLLFRGARYLWWSLGLLLISGVLYATQGDGAAAERRHLARLRARHDRCAADRLAHAARRSQAHAINSTMGSVQGWTSAHVYLGTALLIIATLHAGFQVGWNLHTLAYVLMCVVIASGFFGLYSYLNHPRADLEESRRRRPRGAVRRAVRAGQAVALARAEVRAGSRHRGRQQHRAHDAGRRRVCAAVQRRRLVLRARRGSAGAQHRPAGRRSISSPSGCRVRRRASRRRICSSSSWCCAAVRRCCDASAATSACAAG